MDPSPALRHKERRFLEILKEMGSVLVAFSGGVDSSYLAYAARKTLGDKAVAVTARSESFPEWEFDQAREIARSIGIRHLVTETSELKVPEFRRNPAERCYFCKKELFTELKRIASENGLSWVAEGSNADDTRDFRPGMKAIRELEVRSPLLEAGLSKNDIRALSRTAGLPTWDRPSFACLASRFPYGQEITPEKLAQVASAEKFLRDLGLRQYRVRHHGDTARIEVLPEDMALVIDRRKQVVEALKDAGFLYVSLDLAGYRTGSMNEALKDLKIRKNR